MWWREIKWWEPIQAKSAIQTMKALLSALLTIDDVLTSAALLTLFVKWWWWQAAAVSCVTSSRNIDRKWQSQTKRWSQYSGKPGLNIQSISVKRAWHQAVMISSVTWRDGVMAWRNGWYWNLINWKAVLMKWRYPIRSVTLLIRLTRFDYRCPVTLLEYSVPVSFILFPTFGIWPLMIIVVDLLLVICWPIWSFDHLFIPRWWLLLLDRSQIVVVPFGIHVVRICCSLKPDYPDVMRQKYWNVILFNVILILIVLTYWNWSLLSWYYWYWERNEKAAWRNKH